ncbi:MAG: isocitrate dehydrogenase kinase/phosphatase AceK regulatory subunit, partial [Burkholderiales bacterium]
METSYPVAKNDISFAVAFTLLEGFNKHYRIFQATSQAAKGRFESADWSGVQAANRDRILFYDQRVKEAVEELEREFQAESLNDTEWQQIKFYYIGLLTNHKQPELAESF